MREPAIVDIDVEQQPAPVRRRKAWWIVIGVLVAGLVAFAGIQYPTAPESGSGGGTRGTAPPFDLENLQPNQPPVHLAGFEGEPVVVNFWASWCVPCRREMPALQEVNEAVGDRVALVGVNHQDTRAAARELVAEAGVTYPSGYDPHGRTARDYGLLGMPTTVLITPNGQIVTQHTGELSASALLNAISDEFGIDR